MTTVQGFTGVDIVILGMLAVALVVGWARGFVNVLTGFVVFLITTVIAGQYADTVVGWLNRTWDVQDKLAAVFARQLRLPTEAFKTHVGNISWPKALEWLQSIPIPASYRQTLAHRLTEWSASAGSETAADFIVKQLAAGVLNSLVFLALVAILGAILGVVAGLLNDHVKALPIVGTANSLLGAVAVGLETAVILSLIVGLVVPVLSMYGFASFGQMVDSARVSPYFVSLYSWLRGAIFGLAQGTFFAS